MRIFIIFILYSVFPFCIPNAFFMSQILQDDTWQFIVIFPSLLFSLTVSWLGIRKMMELIDHRHPFRSRVHSPNRNVWLLVLRSLLIELDLGSLHLSKPTLPSPILSRVLVWEGCQCIQTVFLCAMRAPVPQGKNLYVDYVYVLNFICVCVWWGEHLTHAMAPMWRSEDDFWELFYSIPWGWNTGFQSR